MPVGFGERFADDSPICVVFANINDTLHWKKRLRYR